MRTKLLLKLKSFKLEYVLILVGIIMFVPVQNSFAVKSACEFKHRECFSEAGYPACYKKIDIEKYYQFMGEEKTELAESIISDENKCIMLTGNEKIFLQDKRGDYVKFGIRGKDKTFWAEKDALFSR